MRVKYTGLGGGIKVELERRSKGTSMRGIETESRQNQGGNREGIEGA